MASRETRERIIGVLRRATERLTTPRNIALARLRRKAAFRHLHELAREGLVRRGGAGRGRVACACHWRTDLDAGVAD